VSVRSVSPNPRLQRTPLRAPLSRKPLGAGRLRRAVVPLSLAALAISGCQTGPSFEEFRNRLAKTAGDGAVDCGLVKLGSSKAGAVSCVASALATRRPVFVVFQVSGIDSGIFDGLAVNGSSQGTQLIWDSDVYGGSRFRAKSHVEQKPCGQPSVEDRREPIRCAERAGA
jgi:hypothetical protein